MDPEQDYWNQFQPHDDAAGYMPPNGNTGISGYGPGGMPTPAIGPAPTGGHYEGIDWDQHWVPDNPTPEQQAFIDLKKSSPNIGVSQTTAPAGGQRWDQNYFMSTFGSPKTPQELVALEQQITAAGGKVLRNASGVAGKIQTPDGRIIDVINSAGAGGNGFQWLEGPGGGSSGSGMGTLGGLGYGSFVSPIGQFTPPTEQDALNSPGLQFALSEANRMGQNSAAAKGTLLNGRFQQALAGSNIQNALQGYGDVYNRAANTFGINFGVQTRNQDAPYQKFYNLAELGQKAASGS